MIAHVATLPVTSPSARDRGIQLTTNALMKFDHGTLCSLLLGLGLATPAPAQLIRIASGNFTPEASVITFSEVADGFVNPTFTVATATLGSVDVSFASHFIGQSRSGGSVVTLSGSPSGPLSLDLTSGTVYVTDDGANPSSPVLSGSPLFNGPISVFFSKPVAAVGFDGGYFNAIGGTSMEAFDASGSSLGVVTNQALEFEFFGLAEASGANVISGISFYITGAEPAGFAIDNLTFGGAAEVAAPLPGGAGGAGGGFTPVPEPSTYAAFAAAGLLLAVAGRRLRSHADAAPAVAA